MINYWWQIFISHQGKFAFVEQGSQNNATLLFTPDNEKLLKTTFGGNQTSVIIIQLHETLFNMVSKNMEYVGPMMLNTVASLVQPGLRLKVCL